MALLKSILQTAASGAAAFLGLSDTPSAYVGHGGENVSVTLTEDGLEFSTNRVIDGGSFLDSVITGSRVIDGGTF